MMANFWIVCFHFNTVLRFDKPLFSVFGQPNNPLSQFEILRHKFEDLDIECWRASEVLLAKELKSRLKIARDFLDKYLSFQQGLESMMPKVANKISSEVGCISSENTVLFYNPRRGLYGVNHSEGGVQINVSNPK